MTDPKERRSIEQIAEESLPEWKVVPKAANDAEPYAPASDAALPDLAALKRKYFGEAEAVDGADAADAAGDQDAGLVQMEPRVATDGGPATKAVFIEGGRLKAEQG